MCIVCARMMGICVSLMGCDFSDLISVRDRDCPQIGPIPSRPGNVGRSSNCHVRTVTYSLVYVCDVRLCM